MNREEFVDKVVTVDYNARGVVRHLYAAARQHAQQPLCAKAAEFLRVPGCVAVATGFRITRYGGAVESDGLVSSVLLSLWLELRGGEAVIFVEKGFEEVVKAGLDAAGAGKTIVKGLPQAYGEVAQILFNVLDQKKPSLFVAVERPGANEYGRYHNSVGEDITSLTSPVDRLFERLSGWKRPFIAFGDGGNEAGMGLIKHAVEKHVPYGTTCRCGCGEGIAAETTADVLVTASISDLGLFGAMAIADPQTYRQTIIHLIPTTRALFEAGAVDAYRGPSKPGVDGVPIEAISAVAHLLQPI
ncbi:MAG: DUF4392 domain-containing protein [Candidatus Caldarchaeum sp.]|nr:DUF4392 domain-containing protein [Candidatus Caldarchaeum sp.]